MFLIKRAFPAFSRIGKDENLFLKCTVNQTRTYAARKGTREKARRKKVKKVEVEVKKTEFIPRRLLEKTSSKTLVSRRLRDDYKLPPPEDDVWVARFFKWRVYDFQDAVECHRETHHPQIYNLPQAPLHAFIELDMTGVKKNKYVNSFSRLAKIPHPFNHGENRTILVFCKTVEMKEAAELAGASFVGDVDIVKKIEKGDVMLPDFQYILAHPNILPELICLKGLLKKNFPSPKNGTLGIDVGEMVKTFKSGIQYSAMRDETELDYGWVDTAIGTINMNNAELEANFRSLIDDIMSMRPKRDGPFITRAMLKCAPSVERFKINLDSILSDDYQKDGYDSDSDSEEAKKSLKKS